MTKILRIDASPRMSNSISRKIGDEVAKKLLEEDPSATFIMRDLAKSALPFVTDTMIGGYFTPPHERTIEMETAIATSNAYVSEIQAADIIIIDTPIYNFSIPGSLKSYFDLVARAGLTFRMTSEGYQGLLNNKKAYLVISSGGTSIDSPYDMATPYLRQILGFMGITDIEIIPADGRSNDSEKLARAQGVIATL